ncbi:bifunctional DNA-formamidopyrimidine glycosylase/DNA-(apurinic or apyrimidinic site) lyase [Rubrobacter aplysinae]|uniref:bifunctional DNA-formamidopyrimidine glycosylase/DNA-(apurinic or apyrimidinic site) lyase n=1 Tax=Rubrobacter aplysinae TaxID=909625 RepID=UPI00064BC41D|nr:bifunctional DNA-formamidopyrimidine glycosylase/DNA-(apurinic or apyrimidinic site) lyase [Rubrobacter aplysinae]
MPELPEVTVISRDVASLAAGRRVVCAGISDDDVSNAGVEGFPAKLVGQTLRGTSRRGKIIVLDFGEVVGVVHLVISGRVLGFPVWQEPDRMNTVMLEFEGGVVLGFTRLWLGYFDLYEPAGVDGHPLISRLGPDPFSPEFTAGYLTAAFSGRRAAIKGLLLDQSLVAGLGNIYVDEVLFAAGVHPARKADTLTPRETETLHAAILDILGRAIEARGTTFDSYHDAFGETGKYQHQLRVFDREGDPCPACGAEIVKLKVAGRGTHVCPACQPLTSPDAPDA